jgi:hypothetical protein
MTEVINRAGEHGTSYLEKDKAGTGIDVGLCRAFKGDEQRCDLQSSEKKKP